MATARATHKPETPETAFRKAAIRYLMARFQGHIWHMRTVAGIAVRDRLDDHFIIRTACIRGPEICSTRDKEAQYRRGEYQWN